MKKRSARTTTSSRKTKRSSRPIGNPKRKSPRGERAGVTLAYLGLGSNVGDRRAHLEAALREIAAFAPVRRVSSFYRTEPVGFGDQPDFWNAAVEIAWHGTPRALLLAVREVERRVGRTRTFVNGPREIDVDILDLGGRLRAGRDPVLPHPRLAERRFALVPLAEICPSWTHPRTRRSVAELIESLPKTPHVRRISPRRSRAGSPRR